MNGQIEWHENDGSMPLHWGDGKYETNEPVIPPATRLREAIMASPNVVKATPLCEKAIDEMCGEGKGKALVTAYRKGLEKGGGAFSHHEFPLLAQTCFKVLEGGITYDEAMAVLTAPPPEK
jgi:hypothetical protein